MSIQANINQALTLGSYLMTQTDWWKKGSTLAGLKSKVKAENAMFSSIISTPSEKVDAKTKMEDLMELGEQAESTSKKIFEADPSQKTYREYEATKSVLQDLKSGYANAQASVDKRSAEIKQSRDFAKMITEGVPNLSFDPNTYEPPVKKGDK